MEPGSCAAQICPRSSDSVINVEKEISQVSGQAQNLATAWQWWFELGSHSLSLAWSGFPQHSWELSTYASSFRLPRTPPQKYFSKWAATTNYSELTLEINPYETPELIPLMLGHKVSPELMLEWLMHSSCHPGLPGLPLACSLCSVAGKGWDHAQCWTVTGLSLPDSP